MMLNLVIKNFLLKIYIQIETDSVAFLFKTSTLNLGDQRLISNPGQIISNALKLLCAVSLLKAQYLKVRAQTMPIGWHPWEEVSFP